MQTTGRVRARLRRYDDPAKIIVKPYKLLRTNEDEYSINFRRNSTRATPRGSLHSDEYKNENTPSLHAARGRNISVALG